jgi:hypothetical protein
MSRHCRRVIAALAAVTLAAVALAGLATAALGMMGMSVPVTSL